MEETDKWGRGEGEREGGRGREGGSEGEREREREIIDVQLCTKCVMETS